MPEDERTHPYRADALRNRERIIEAARVLLAQSPSATLVDIAAAAGVPRSTLYRRFADRDELIAALEERPDARGSMGRGDALPPGRLGRERPVELDAIHVFDVVPPPALPEQLVAEAERIAKVPVALYVLDIDGTHLLRLAGAERLDAQIEAPLAIGPELDADGLAHVRQRLRGFPGAEAFPLWLRGRAIGVMIAFGRPVRSLVDMARQAAAAARSQTATPTPSPGRSAARGRRPQPRSSRACFRPALRGSRAARSPGTSSRATRWRAIGSTSSRTPTAYG